MNELYGSHFIERQRSSGYRSTVYAMAEIVDNSVDAKASEIKIVLSEKESHTGSRSRTSLDKIFFLDNGTGMTVDRMNTCLTFSEGDGRNDSRIGAFGVGLPNSSISCCKRVEVYSRQNNGEWNYVFLDVDDQMTRSNPGYERAINKVPNYEELNIDKSINTIIIWSKLDRLDVSRANTLLGRSEKLLGRIYRYKLLDGLTISFEGFRQGKKEPTIEERNILPYDPLFVTEKENYITRKIWHYSENEDPAGKNPEFGHLEKFNSMYYYKKHTEGYEKNKTSKGLFQKLDDYWDVPFSRTLNGKTYTWTIKASFAYSTISNPGIRSGGSTEIGKEFREKMSGSAHFRSSNIFFIRSGREIDFGSFGLYTVTDEKNRFWTIEIHFDSDLDELMGISNTKQSIMFKHIKLSELDSVNETDEIPLGVMRELIWADMSDSIMRAIKIMRKNLTGYARDFRDTLRNYEESGPEGKSPIPTAEPAVIEVIPKSEPWSQEQITEVSKFLKERYMSVEFDKIREQVETHSKGLSRTIVIYAPNESGNLFELTQRKGRLITLINTNHIYYTNIIEPLKGHRQLKTFAIAIEMLIASWAYEMDRLIIDNEEKYKDPLEVYLLQISSRLKEFITDSHIRINTEKFEEEIYEEMEEAING